MTVLNELAPYSDERGNRIEYDGPAQGKVRVDFKGSNNVLVVAADAKIARLVISFDCDNGAASIGGSRGVPAFSATIRVGQDSTVQIGSNVSTTEVCGISATEGTTVSVGDDVMFASQNQVRADDGHAIYDVRSGKRVNVSRSIRIGNHVWLGYRVTVLGGVTIGDGTVVGFGAIVTKSIPNNCIAAGVPAKVVRRNVAWERPHLSRSKPYYKPDARSVTKSPYWNETVELTAPEVVAVSPPSILRRARAKVRRMLTR